MANSTSHFLPYPIKNARYSVLQGFRVAAGTPTDPTTPDTELSSDGGASFADIAEEITTGGSNGMGYVTLTGAEMNNTVLALAFKSANCLTSLMNVVPMNLSVISSGTASAGAAGTLTLQAALAYDLTNCFIRTTGGTGGGGTGGANNQARLITGYVASTGVCTVTPNWETTPDATTTYDVLLPPGVTLGMLKTLNPTTAGRTLAVDASNKAPATIAAGDIATDAIDANALKADAVTEIAAGIWNALTSGITTANSIGKRILDLFTGITSLAQWLGLMAGKQAANSTALTEIKATGAGSGTYDPTTDSPEAIRDRGDAAWVTGTAPDNAGIAAIQAVTDELADTLVDNAGTFRFTAAALALAPTGGSAPTADEIALATHLLDWEGIVAPVPDFCLLQAARSTRNDWDTTTSAGKRTVFEEDGTTPAFAQTLTTNPAGEPITGASTP